MSETGRMTLDPATYYGHRFPAEIISHAVWLYHVFRRYAPAPRQGGLGIWIDPGS
jgi:hypothetical protein